MPDITPNLGIKKPLGNENVSRASFNENYDIIDANAAPISKAQMVKLTKDDGYALTPPGTDLNTLTTSGFYYGGNLTNAPEGTVFHRITVMMSASTSGIQIAVSNGGNQYIRNMTGSVWGRWVLQLNDNAPTWTNLTLQNGAQAYSPGSTPKCTKIGNVVYLKGAVSGLTTYGTIIATLPAGFRPSDVTYTFTQNASQRTSGDARNARWAIGTDGTIKNEAVTGGTYLAADWFPIDTSFIVG